jgi:predicted aldo/keto reductase-like oxidoreductase
MNRREFLQSAAALAATRHALESYAAPPGTGTGIALRPLGKTGEKVSMIGVGGGDIGHMREDKESMELVDQAIDMGATFIDTAWIYQGGVSERRIGKVIAAPSKRQKVFLMTKVKARDAAGAQKQLEDSLRRLRTDVIDLWQFHNLETFEDVATIFGPGGAMEVAQKARKEGKFRYLGFTGHTDPAVHLDMLDRYDWDAVMMSLNVVDAHWHSFQNQVLPKVVEKNMGVLAFKTLSRGRALIRAHTLSEALRYVWSLPVSVLISGMDRMEFLKTNLDLAMKFEPMPAAEKKALLERTKPFAGPDIDYYKKVVKRA